MTDFVPYQVLSAADLNAAINALNTSIGAVNDAVAVVSAAISAETVARTAALQNYLANAGFSLSIHGAQAGDIFVGSGLHADMWGSVHVNAISNTVPEITAQFAMNSNTGLANSDTAYKIGLTASCLAGPLSAGPYGANIITQGYGGTHLVTGLESDVNNIGVDAHSVGGSTAVYGMVSVAAGTAGSTAGLWVISTSGGSWWDGVAVSSAANAAYFDGATSPIGIAIHGAHTTGIDMLAGFPISIAMAIPNNSPIQALNSSGTLRNVACLDGSNFLQLGDPTTIIYANQSILPAADNVYSLGTSGQRWSSIWAANGTIQTSDPTLKTDVANLPAMLPLVQGITPKSFKWIVGGHALEEITVDQDDAPLTEMRNVVVQRVVVENGVATQTDVTEEREFPVYDEYPMVDAHGYPVMEPQTIAAREAGAQPTQKMHRVPRRGMKSVTVNNSVPVPGKRTHVGFMASDVKAAFDTMGVDYGAYVKSNIDGTEALRPDQLLPLLWKAVQELAADFAAYKTAHP